MKQLYIENFKCIQSENIHFEKLTVLAGQNGAGKSTIIQALSILKQSYDVHKTLIKDLKYLYLNDYYCELGTFRDIIFCEADNDKIIFRFREDDKEILIECSEDKKNHFRLNIDSISMDNVDNSRNFIDMLVSDFDFISADRFGPKTFYHVDGNFSTNKVGKFGEYTGLLLSNLKDDLNFLEFIK
jgi:predicted ATPase